MELTVIGCSGSFAGPASPASCYVLSAPDAEGRTWNIALDMGNGALGALQRHIHPRDLDAVLLTHLHPDHCFDIAGLYVILYYQPDPALAMRGLLPVFAPAGARTRLDRAYEPEDGPGMVGAFDYRDVADGGVFAVGPFRVTAHAVRHPVEAYAYRIEIADPTGGDPFVLAYTGDTDTCDGVVEAARDADFFLCEAAFQEDRDTVRGIHLTGLRAGETAAKAGARRVVLTHIPPWTDPAVLLDEASRGYRGPLSAAVPDGVYRLGRDVEGTPVTVRAASGGAR